MTMKTYVCTICGYLYEEAKGNPGNGIAPGTKWESLPDGWVCPICKAPKSAFKEKRTEPQGVAPSAVEVPELEKELSPMEMSILCSNLARGCEKQYLTEESELFRQLADHFRTKSEPQPDASFEKLLMLVQQNLEREYPYANAIAAKKPDRGAQRALVWSEKVTRMLDVLLKRYEEEGEKMLEHTGVYVCTICGFVFLGDAPPELCPVCKVPSWKFEKVEGRTR